MAGNYTLTIIKPDAFGAAKAGKIIALLEEKGFTVKAARVLHLTQQQAGEFYAVHRERPFYKELVSFMTSGPCMPMVLEKASAVSALRDAIGATDPAEAAAGTVRKLYAESKGRNAIHASDSDENATREAGFFFAETDLIFG
ncbi:MAG: nucleoside-diphosphate kinase [Gemmatimonadaceae bacterium]|nr:nucleoside-diphosphate kinase [Gemmatimonadaceae bacterium]NUO94093.1 nucleoside-diphosphate kinase [Gemmatimonadaceae bacterium]NUP54590.1 nucleoside-diphosphate kinase [Gemmatimonadaceae bacterium]NUP72294.1 nucleoside-diphosphate kinase [Gemmatimonadaceae bacterium]NUR33529.1 nucleoside-diphosphate kinase [Gemmatimonadaceae bacterium]